MNVDRLLGFGEDAADGELARLAVGDGLLEQVALFLPDNGDEDRP